jgi:hypothetical protein
MFVHYEADFDKKSLLIFFIVHSDISPLSSTDFFFLIHKKEFTHTFT